MCLCRPGWVGEFCAQRPIAVNIAGPPVLSARPGQTVQFDCSGEPQIRIQEAMEFSWSRENAAMPDRAADSGFGLLGKIKTLNHSSSSPPVISAVEVADSGVYTCTVTAGRHRVSGSRELAVRETAPRPRPSAPRPASCPPVEVRVEPANLTVSEGGAAVLRCLTSGPAMAPRWSRAGAELRHGAHTAAGSELRLVGAVVADRGWYEVRFTNIDRNFGTKRIIFI